MTSHDRREAVGRRFFRSQRCRPRLERRGEGDDAPRVIVGYAAVFYRADDPGTEFQLWRETYERIMPGAFDDAVKDDLVRGLTNHDANWLLGRTDTNSLRLSVDDVGLRYEIDPPDTQAGRDTLTLLGREDLDGSSFGFSVAGKRGLVKWVDENRDGRLVEIRELHSLELFDVGPVTFPAYESTSAGLRSRAEHLAEARADYERWKGAPPPGPEFDARQHELEMDAAIAEAQLGLLE